MHFSSLFVCETLAISVVQKFCCSFVLMTLFVKIAEDDTRLGTQRASRPIRNHGRPLVLQTCKYLYGFAYQPAVHSHGLGGSVRLTSVLFSVYPHYGHGVCVVEA